MSGIVAQDLAHTIVVALERMAFVLTESIDATAAAELFPPTFHSRIAFRGPEKAGTIHLSASEGFVVEMSSSMLGLDPDDVGSDLDTLGPQAVCELANVIGGEIIVMLGGKHVEFTLDLPEPCDGGAVPREGTEATCYLESDGELLEVRISS